MVFYGIQRELHLILGGENERRLSLLFFLLKDRFGGTPVKTPIIAVYVDLDVFPGEVKIPLSAAIMRYWRLTSHP